MAKLKLADGTGTIELRFVVEDVDRHNKVRLYFRRKGSTKVRLRAPVGSPQFFAEYGAALAGQPLASGAAKRVRRAPASEGSLRWLVEQYYQSADFKRLRAPMVRRRVLDALCAEPIAPGVPGVIGSLPYRDMPPAKVRALRDRKAATPEAANTRLKALRRLFAFAVDSDLADHNPAALVKKIKNESTGFHTWSSAEVRQFEARHPAGTMARLALGLLLFTGQRRGDVCKFGPQNVIPDAGIAPHLRGGHAGDWLALRQGKGGVMLTLPILPELKALLDATPSRGSAFIATRTGKPFTAGGFGNKFREWCDQAGLAHCTAHGLRKAGATIAAEHGATERQLQAIFGWKAARESVRYTQAAEQKLLAGAAMRLLVPDREPVQNVPLSKAAGKRGTKSAKKPLEIKARKMSWRPRQARCKNGKRKQ